MWFDKANPNTLFCDKRKEVVEVTDRSHGATNGKRILKIEPDSLIDFRAMPFPDNTFHLVAFDPPHLVRAGKRSWLSCRYGVLERDWPADISDGFRECFRVLKPNGTLVFKWNETQIKVSEVLKCTDEKPLFGQRSGAKGMTHWLVFMKFGEVSE